MKADDDSRMSGDSGGNDEPKRDVKKMKAAVAENSAQQSHDDAFNSRKAKKDAERSGEPIENEPFMDKMKRGMTNTFQKCGLCCFKFKKQSQITALEYKITTRQKKFGVDYLTLVQDKAPQAQLKTCLRDAMNDIAVLQEQMNEHFDKIDDKADEVDAKINNRPPPVASGDNDDGDEVEEAKKPSKRSKSKSSAEEESEEEPPSQEQAGAEDSGEAAAPKKTKSSKKKKSKKKSKSTSSKDSNFSIDDE